MKILGIILGISTFITPIYMMGASSYFVDFPSLIIVLLPSLFCVLARHGLEGLKSLFLRENSKEALNTLGCSAFISGAIGTLIGLVLMLQSLSDPARIGPAMAVSFLSSLYGGMIYLLSYFANKEIKI